MTMTHNLQLLQDNHKEANVMIRIREQEFNINNI